MARKFLQRGHLNRKPGIRNGKYSIIALVVLICLILVACFFLSSVNDPEGITTEQVYLSICRDHGFSMYQQEITNSSTAGIVKGYTSTVLTANVQFDFYEFESEKYATDAYKRIVGWAMVHYGDKSYAGVEISGNEWSLNSNGVYFKAERKGKLLIYMVCTDPVYAKHAESIFEKVAEV